MLLHSYARYDGIVKGIYDLFKRVHQFSVLRENIKKIFIHEN